MSKTFVGACSALLLMTACTSPTQTDAPAGGSAGGNAPAASAPVAIATTTQLGSVLGDITQCAGTTSQTLMGPGDDPHDFSVASSQVADLVRAPLVIANGLGLEAGLTSALTNAQRDGATVVEIAPQLNPLSYADIEATVDEQHAGHEHAEGDHAEHGHDHGAEDPHVHMDVARMARAATVIGAELAKATGEERYTACGAEVEARLTATDAEVRQILSAVPADKRVLITDHEAYNYFADAYDFEVAGVVIPGGSTDAEPSSADLAGLVKVIEEDQVSAIFSNNTVNPRLVDAVAAESGRPIQVVQLFEGSVGPQGSGAETYAGMMTTNARRIADALK